MSGCDRLRVSFVIGSAAGYLTEFPEYIFGRACTKNCLNSQYPGRWRMDFIDADTPPSTKRMGSRARVWLSLSPTRRVGLVDWVGRTLRTLNSGELIHGQFSERDSGARVQAEKAGQLEQGLELGAENERSLKYSHVYSQSTALVTARRDSLFNYFLSMSHLYHHQPARWLLQQCSKLYEDGLCLF